MSVQLPTQFQPADLQFFLKAMSTALEGDMVASQLLERCERVQGFPALCLMALETPECPPALRSMTGACLLNTARRAWGAKTSAGCMNSDEKPGLHEALLRRAFSEGARNVAEQLRESVVQIALGVRGDWPASWQTLFSECIKRTREAMIVAGDRINATGGVESMVSGEGMGEGILQPLTMAARGLRLLNGLLKQLMGRKREYQRRAGAKLALEILPAVAEMAINSFSLYSSLSRGIVRTRATSPSFYPVDALPYLSSAPPLKALIVSSGLPIVAHNARTAAKLSARLCMMGGVDSFTGPNEPGCNVFFSMLACMQGLVTDCNALVRMDGAMSQALLDFGDVGGAGGVYGGFAENGVGGGALGAASYLLQHSDVVGVGSGGLEDGGSLLSSRASPDTSRGTSDRNNLDSMGSETSRNSVCIQEALQPINVNKPNPNPNPHSPGSPMARRVLECFQWGGDTWSSTAGRALRALCASIVQLFCAHPLTLCAQTNSPMPSFAMWAASLLKSGVPTPFSWGDSSTCTEELPPPPPGSTLSLKIASPIILSTSLLPSALSTILRILTIISDCGSTAGLGIGLEAGLPESSPLAKQGLRCLIHLRGVIFPLASLPPWAFVLTSLISLSRWEILEWENSPCSAAAASDASIREGVDNPRSWAESLLGSLVGNDEGALSVINSVLESSGAAERRVFAAVRGFSSSANERGLLSAIRDLEGAWTAVGLCAPDAIARGVLTLPRWTTWLSNSILPIVHIAGCDMELIQQRIVKGPIDMGDCVNTMGVVTGVEGRSAELLSAVASHSADSVGGLSVGSGDSRRSGSGVSGCLLVTPRVTKLAPLLTRKAIWMMATCIGLEVHPHQHEDTNFSTVESDSGVEKTTQMFSPRLLTTLHVAWEVLGGKRSKAFFLDTSHPTRSLSSQLSLPLSNPNPSETQGRPSSKERIPTHAFITCTYARELLSAVIGMIPDSFSPIRPPLLAVASEVAYFWARGEWGSNFSGLEDLGVEAQQGPFFLLLDLISKAPVSSVIHSLDYIISPLPELWNQPSIRPFIIDLVKRVFLSVTQQGVSLGDFSALSSLVNVALRLLWDSVSLAGEKSEDGGSREAVAEASMELFTVILGCPAVRQGELLQKSKASFIQLWPRFLAIPLVSPEISAVWCKGMVSLLLFFDQRFACTDGLWYDYMHSPSFSEPLIRTFCFLPGRCPPNAVPPLASLLALIVYQSPPEALGPILGILALSVTLGRPLRILKESDDGKKWKSFVAEFSDLLTKGGAVETPLTHPEAAVQSALTKVVEGIDVDVCGKRQKNMEGGINLSTHNFYEGKRELAPLDAFGARGGGGKNNVSSRNFEDMGADSEEEMTMLSGQDPHPFDLPVFTPPPPSLGADRVDYTPIPITNPASASSYLTLLSRAILHCPSELLSSISKAITMFPNAPLCAGLLPSSSGSLANFLTGLASPCEASRTAALSSLSPQTTTYGLTPSVIIDLLAQRTMVGLLDAMLVDGCTSLARGHAHPATLRLTTMAVFSGLLAADCALGRLSITLSQTLSSGAARKVQQGPIPLFKEVYQLASSTGCEVYYDLGRQNSLSILTLSALQACHGRETLALEGEAPQTLLQALSIGANSWGASRSHPLPEANADMLVLLKGTMASIYKRLGHDRFHNRIKLDPRLMGLIFSPSPSL